MTLFLSSTFFGTQILAQLNDSISEQIPKTATDLTSLKPQIRFSSIIVQGVETTIIIEVREDASFEKLKELIILINGLPTKITIINNKVEIPYTFKQKEDLTISSGDFYFTKTVDPIPLWLSILPPLIAIIIALLFREVFSALFIGLFVGTSIIYYYQEHSFFIGLFKGLLAIADTYLIESLNNRGHLAIIIFSMLIGAMVSLITRNGGMKGVVNKLSRYANSPRSGQFITWLLGLAIFFDDYANTLVVGNTMRPVTDRLKISREKLSYIVDSTAAPVAAIAFVTTWVGAELSYIEDGIFTIGLNENAYTVFLHSLKYSFYPLFTLIFIFMLIMRKMDFGPMYKAEVRAKQVDFDKLYNNSDGFSNKLNELEVSDHIKARWYNAVIPVSVVIFGTIAGLVSTGLQEVTWDSNLGFTKNLSLVIGNADSYKALLWSSMGGVLIAIILTLGQKILNLKESIDSLINGFRTMLTAILILILAWSLALVTEHLHTANFISQVLIFVEISPFLVPALTFILAALISFSTGSSWGTMAILYPLILPASWLITSQYGMDHNTSMNIFYNVVSSVLAGSVLGDHCSPISDTTILSSLASSCNHIDHVRTQLPYAMTVGGVSIFIGTIPAAYGFPFYIVFPAGLIVMYLVLVFFGKKQDNPTKV
ncbi:MAG: hypothetical protein K8S00_05170 [Bacteroidales bacterium]|nr:hypothetical protein [Bacteroidales bacterium]